MRFRFLYLGSNGGQTEVASLDDLKALIEQGIVGEQTPLFDALTQQWAPARAHAVYRLLNDEAVANAAAGTAAQGTAAAELPDMGLTVTASATALDTDQAVRALIKEREREGERDREREREGAEPIGRRGDPWADPASWSARAEPTAATAFAHVAAAPSASVVASAPRGEAPRAREPVELGAAPGSAATVPLPPPQRTTAAAPVPARAVIAPPPAAVPAPAPLDLQALLATPIPLDRVGHWGKAVLLAGWRMAEHGRAPTVLVGLGIGGLLLILLTAVRGGIL